MPAHDGFGYDQDERAFPAGPESFQDNPQQLMQGSQSTARPFGVQRQDLLAESEIFKDKVFSGTESADNPSQEMSEQYDHRQKHGQNLIETRRIKPSTCLQLIHSACAPSFDEGHPWSRTRFQQLLDSVESCRS